MDVNVNPEVIKKLADESSATVQNISAALDTLRREFLSLDWDDNVARITERILNAHIDTMNSQLYNLSSEAAALRTLTEHTDFYTSHTSSEGD